MPVAPPIDLRWISQPSATQIIRAEALHARRLTGGHAAMRCVVQVDGGLTRCSADAPTFRSGLAGAILSLVSAYRLDAPMPSPPVTIKVDFPRLADVPPRLVGAPTAAEVAAASPVGISGDVAFECEVTLSGAVEQCAVTSEPVHDVRLDPAELTLVRRHRLKPASLDGHDVATPATFQIRFGEAYVSFAKALGSGHAVVHCLVDIDGHPHACQVVQGTPKGVGFGAAAAKAASKFRIKPPMVNGKAVAAQITIPIKFEVGPFAATFFGPEDRLVASAPWTRAPTLADVSAIFAKTEIDARASGAVAMRCSFRPDGGLRDCAVTPPSKPTLFNTAALGLAADFGVDAGGIDADALQRIRIDLRIAFPAPPLATPRPKTDFDWFTYPGEEAMLATYPTAARAAGVAQGDVTLQCRIGAEGALRGCESKSETPHGWGFAKAAHRLAETMRANLWTRSGEPAADQKVKLPFHFVESPLDRGASTGSEVTPATSSGSGSEIWPAGQARTEPSPGHADLATGLA